MNLLFGHDTVVAQWADKKFGRPGAPWFHAVGIIDKEGTLVGAAVFRDWNGFNVELAYYGPGALTSRVIVGLMRYCFGHLQVTRVTARTLRSNKIVNRGLPRLGFHFEGVSKRYFGPHRADDSFNYSLLKQDYERWMERRNGIQSLSKT